MPDKIAALVRELEEVMREWALLTAPKAAKLSATAFCATAAKIAGLTVEEAKGILRELEADQGVIWPRSWHFCNVLARRFAEVHWRAPTSDGRRLSAYDSGNAGTERWNLFELAAAAALMAAARSPGAFGSNDNLENWQRRVAALEQRRQELRGRLEAAKAELEAEARRLAEKAAALGG